jgi:diguanylate cyclase (GGDEF)-like protein
VIQVTISLGVALLTPDVASLASLIDRADQAMYAAKQAGRNHVEVYLEVGTPYA